MLVSVKKDVPETDAALLAVRGSMPNLGDMADTAELLVKLDFLTAVDTSIVHMSGALGKSV